MDALEAKTCQITNIGKRMAKIPLSARYARMIIEAEKLGILKDIVTIAAIYEIGSLINTYRNPETNKTFSYANFTDESNSDLIVELNIWNKIQDIPYSQLKQIGINVKNYNRIKEIYEKLNSSLENIMNVNKMTSNREDIIKSYLASMPDKLYKYCHGYYDTPVVIDDIRDYNLDRNSCIKSISDSNNNFIIGTSGIIEYKDKYGCKQKMYIVKSASVVSIDMLEEIYPNLIKRNRDELSLYYDSCLDTCVISELITFKGRKLSTKFIRVDNHPQYQKLRDNYELRAYGFTTAEYKQKTAQKEIVLSNKLYNIHYDRKGDNPFIRLFEPDLDIIKEDTIKLDDGRNINLQYNYNNYKTISELKENEIKETIINEMRKYNFNRFPATRSIKKLIEQLPLIVKKEIKLSFKVTEPIYVYTGFKISDKGIQLELFMSAKEAEKSIQESLRFLLAHVVQERYSDKKFRVRINGKIMETKKTEETKVEFRQYVQEIIEATTIESFVEDLNFLEELFQEATNKMAI